MARVITLSRTFLKGHPRAGEPTYFVEKVYMALYVERKDDIDFSLEDILYKSNEGIFNSNPDIIVDFFFSLTWAKAPDFTEREEYDPKHHTIRSGKRWKAGDMVSLRVWSGMPYRSKQVAIAPDFKIPRVADVEIDIHGNVKIDGTTYWSLFAYSSYLDTLAKNDGLALKDFADWFNPSLPFSGQIIFFTDVKAEY